MLFLKIAWRNIWRNKRRTLITIASVFFAVILAVFMRSAVNGVYDKMIHDMVSFSSGYLQIHSKGYWEEPSLESTFEEDQNLFRFIESEEEVSGYAPRLQSFALASSGERTKGIMILGIDPVKENSVTNLKEKIYSGNYFENYNEPEILLGSGLADYLRLHVNDTLILLGQGYRGSMAAGKFIVSGILQLGSPDLNKSIVWMTLKSCREFLGTGEHLSSISLMLRDNDDLEHIKNDLQPVASENNFEVKTWQEMQPELVQLIEVDNAGNIIIVYILYMIISFGIFGTILMMLNERSHEFGILLAIGMKKRLLASIIITESFLIAGIGIICGIFGSVPLVFYFRNNPITFKGEIAEAYAEFGMEPIIPMSTEASVFYNQAIVVFVIVMILSFYPFIRIFRMKAIKALTA